MLLLVISDEGTAGKSRRAAAGVRSEEQLDRVHGAERASEVVQLGWGEALREVLHDERLGGRKWVERGVAAGDDRELERAGMSTDAGVVARRVRLFGSVERFELDFAKDGSSTCKSRYYESSARVSARQIAQALCDEDHDLPSFGSRSRCNRTRRQSRRTCTISVSLTALGNPET